MGRDGFVRVVLGLLAVISLLLVYLFQGINVAGWLDITSGTLKFMVNRSVRFLINDGLAIMLIYALFKEQKYVLFAIAVQVFGLLFILIPYFVIKVNFPGYNGPLISFLHRLVLNPTLLLILIPAFFYQKHQGRELK